MCSGCGSKKKNGNGAVPASLPAIPGEGGLVRLEYVGEGAGVEYGPVTGARYPFQEANPRYVDRRDAEKMMQNSPSAFVERIDA